MVSERLERRIGSVRPVRLAATKRVALALSRSRHAAIGAGIGAALGGLFDRNAASTAAAIGGLLGAIVGEKRAATRSRIEEVAERTPEAVEIDPFD